MVPGAPFRAVIWCRAHPPWGLGPRCRYGPHRPQPFQQYCQTLSATRNVHLFRCVTQGFRKTSLSIASALFAEQWPHPAPPVLLERSSVKLPRSTQASTRCARAAVQLGVLCSTAFPSTILTHSRPSSLQVLLPSLRVKAKHDDVPKDETMSFLVLLSSSAFPPACA